jgi:hypothetical protein
VDKSAKAAWRGEREGKKQLAIAPKDYGCTKGVAVEGINRDKGWASTACSTALQIPAEDGKRDEREEMPAEMR